MNRPLPKPGEVFRHFKGNQYKILAIGHHSETKEKMVIYAKISKYGYEITKRAYVIADEPCIRPLDMFMSEVDHVKYPDVKQKYRFEKVE